MKTDYIGVLDSGIGGLTVLKRLTTNLDNRTFLYLGDNENAPYGNKTDGELLSLGVENVSTLLSYGANYIVIACNTLSLTVLQKLKRIFNVPIFGVFPPAEIFSIKNQNTLLLSTVRTSKYFNNLKNVTSIGLKDLAMDIENNVFNLNSVKLNAHLKDVTSRYDTVILGCTHYPFIKKQIFNHLKPQEIIDGIDNAVHQLSKTLQISKKPVIHKGNSVLFLGKNAIYNQKIWNTVVKND